MSFNSLFDFTRSETATKTVIWSGLIAGVLDSMAGVIVYYIYFGLNPLQVLQFIASGIYGPEAINGGPTMVVAGLFLHFFIAYVCAVIYFAAYSKIRVLYRYKNAMGLVFGLGIWMVMNLLVLPASNIPKSPVDIGLVVIGIVWHMVLVGWPIAAITSKYFSAGKYRVQGD